jgi:phosphatidylinositol glycan class Z
MTLLKWMWAEDAQGTVAPAAIYYTLRLVMFALSFVLEDWAIHELVPSPRFRSQAVVLVASSYVTWTLQTHTFSNSVETLLVAWSLVLIERIVNEKVGRSRRICLRNANENHRNGPRYLQAWFLVFFLPSGFSTVLHFLLSS